MIKLLPITLIIFLLTSFSNGAESPNTNVARTIHFNWIEIDSGFFFEVVNNTETVFKLDEIWVEGYNVFVLWYDNNSKLIDRDYELLLLDRGAPKIIEIPPGSYHRSSIPLDTYISNITQEVDYVKFLWTGNTFGTKLPKEAFNYYSDKFPKEGVASDKYWINKGH